MGEPIEYALRDYAKEVDLLSLFNRRGGWLQFPDLHVRIMPEEKSGIRNGMPGSFAVSHFLRGSDQPRFSLPPGPKLCIGSGSREKPLTSWIVVSLEPLLSTAPSLRTTHTVYAHTFTNTELSGLKAKSGKSYCGVTKQGWAARWHQHRNTAQGGSPYLFHKAIMACAGWADVHQVISYGLDHDTAMNLEEELVDRYSLYPHGLNAIPGGHAGIRYLARQAGGGFHVSPKDWENRDVVLRRFAQHCERIGRPNPLAAALWRDDQYAASIICANPNNFTREQVDEVRLLSSLNWTHEAIAGRLGCNPDRVHRLLRGATYTRVH